MCPMAEFVEYFNNLIPGADLNLLFAGRQECPPDKHCGGSRTYFLLHHILGGSGTVGLPAPGEGEPEPVRLTRGDTFCYFPEQPLQYCSSHDDPWEYTWTGFNGRRAEAILRCCGFTPEKTVLPGPPSFPLEQLFDTLLAVLCRRDPGFDLAADGLLMQILGSLARLTGRVSDSPPSTAVTWVEAMKLFMETNFQKPITVARVVSHIGLERSYASRLFKEHTGTTIQQYLIDVRMNRARKLLAEGSLSIADVAHSVGYADYGSFERRFRRETGGAPGKFRY